MTNHHSSGRRALALAILMVATSCLTAAVANASAGHRDTVVPVRHVAGLTGGELLGESWAARLVLPADNRFVGRCQPFGRGGQVLQPVIGDDGTATCIARPGKPIFLRYGTFCNDVEPPPYFGADAAAQRACALALDESVVALRIAVDGRGAVDIHRSRYELISPQRTVQLPPDNFVGVPPQRMTFVAHAWGALVHGLRRGRHSITFQIVTADFDDTVTVVVDVVPGGH